MGIKEEIRYFGAKVNLAPKYSPYEKAALCRLHVIQIRPGEEPDNGQERKEGTESQD